MSTYPLTYEYTLATVSRQIEGLQEVELEDEQGPDFLFWCYARGQVSLGPLDIPIADIAHDVFVELTKYYKCKPPTERCGWYFIQPTIYFAGTVQCNSCWSFVELPLMPQNTCAKASLDVEVEMSFLNSRESAEELLGKTEKNLFSHDTRYPPSGFLEPRSCPETFKQDYVRYEKLPLIRFLWDGYSDLLCKIKVIAKVEASGKYNSATIHMLENTMSRLGKNLEDRPPFLLRAENVCIHEAGLT